VANHAEGNDAIATALFAYDGRLKSTSDLDTARVCATIVGGGFAFRRIG
jgi:hypothetical protein